jgi:prepilin-type N-terminal cleavage/methylation domain-containing protein
MTRLSPARRRPGFTLLEMVLATSIAVLLLGALYVSLDMQVRHMEVAREVVVQSTLARGLFNRLVSDISPSVGTPDPSRYRTSGTGAASSSGTSAATPTSGSGATTDATGTTGTTGSSPTSDPTATTTPTPASSPTLLALQGDVTTLTLLVTRLPRDPVARQGEEGPGAASDLRRISYALPGGFDAPLGLVRQEITLLTGEEPEIAAQDISDPASKLILAPEVKGLAFSYFDGTSWLDSWDSSQLGADGQTPIGPPAAIAVTLQIARSSAPEDVKTFRHVIAIPTANGPPQQSTTEPAP